MKRLPDIRKVIAGGALLLNACSLAPDYQPPDMPQPAAYKESGAWVEATPDDGSARGAWWVIFGDPQLNALETQVTEANQHLKAAVAAYDQARAAAGIARAAYFPNITANGGATRQRESATVANVPGNRTYNDFTMGADLTYEIDLWGRVRNTVSANEAGAEASAADLANVDLSLHAELADDYFALRGDDVQQKLLEDTVAADTRALDLTRQRFQGGAAPELDVDQAENQLDNAKTQATDLHLQRAQLEHALAILTGVPPENFNLAPAPLAAKLPGIATGLPSALLQRRPDIAAAERRTAAANAEIGVARAAWFPDFNLSAMFGVESQSVARWMTAPSEIWSLGPSVTMPLFEGGQISALNDQARAAYEQAAANYRQTVLEAYGEVEDNLVALHRLDEETKTQTAATRAAERALRQAEDRYKAGLTTYLDVVTAKNSALQAEQASILLTIRQMSATIHLVKAIGGGWQASAGDGVME